ncbi:MAG: baseplate J/gp47 family protein [Clostridiaceae bacterium]
MAETKEVILERMLSNISDEYDKSEGSFPYDVEKPIAIEMEALQVKADSIVDRRFADTATGEDLDRVCEERGVYRKLATKAFGTVVITGSVEASINSGDKVASDTITYIFTEDKVIDGTGQANVNIECEVAGSYGNVPINAIKYFPQTLDGLIIVTNTVAISNGYDEETDEELRDRFYQNVRTPSTSGNKYHYLNWAKEVTGIGDAKVFPLALGHGTVKVVVVNSNKRAADSLLISSVSSYIEENRPIGATVSVISAIEKAINVNATLTIDSNNYSLETVTVALEDVLTEYFKDIAFVETYVSYAKIGSLILSATGVLDYSNLRVNNGTSNISLGDEEIPILGGVTLG